MHSKSLCRRRDESFHSAGENDSEYRGFRDLKKYYVYRYGCPIKDVKKRKQDGGNTVCFICVCVFFFFFFFVVVVVFCFLFVLFIALEID